VLIHWRVAALVIGVVLRPGEPIARLPRISEALRYIMPDEF